MHITNQLKRTLALALPTLGAAVIERRGGERSAAERPGSAQPDRLPTLVCAPTPPPARPLGFVCQLKGGVGALPKGARTLLVASRPASTRS